MKTEQEEEEEEKAMQVDDDLGYFFNFQIKKKTCHIDFTRCVKTAVEKRWTVSFISEGEMLLLQNKCEDDETMRPQQVCQSECLNQIQTVLSTIKSSSCPDTSVALWLSEVTGNVIPPDTDPYASWSAYFDACVSNPDISTLDFETQFMNVVHGYSFIAHYANYNNSLVTKEVVLLSRGASYQMRSPPMGILIPRSWIKIGLTSCGLVSFYVNRVNGTVYAVGEGGITHDRWRSNTFGKKLSKALHSPHGYSVQIAKNMESFMCNTLSMCEWATEQLVKYPDGILTRMHEHTISATMCNVDTSLKYRGVNGIWHVHRDLKTHLDPRKVFESVPNGIIVENENENDSTPPEVIEHMKSVLKSVKCNNCQLELTETTQSFYALIVPQTPSITYDNVQCESCITDTEGLKDLFWKWPMYSLNNFRDLLLNK